MSKICGILFKIDVGVKNVSEIGKLYNYGKSAVGEDWVYINSKNLNRLYYIHSGGGTYSFGGRDYRFIPDKLYFLPYTAKISPRSDPNNYFLHSYADFELIPPITAYAPAICDPNTDEMMSSACRVFLDGAVLASEKRLNISDLSDNLTTLCTSAIKYLAHRVAEINGFLPVSDEVVIDSLEYMLENMSRSITIKEISGRYFLTEDSFIRRFKKSMCITPYAWLKTVRLKAARSLLDNGKTLDYAAAAVGYSDAAALLHAMKKRL